MRALVSATSCLLGLGMLMPAVGLADEPRPRLPVNTPFSSELVGIPGPAFLCIKQCEFDLIPCDPPVFKKADGRCSDGG